VSGITYFEELDSTAIAGDEGVLMFKTAEGLNNGTLTPADAITALSFDNPIRFLSEGENGNELLATDDSGNVFRRCVPTSRCRADLRDRKLVRGLAGVIHSIAVSKDEETYLLAEDRGDDGSDVWQCPFDPSEVGVREVECTLTAFKVRFRDLLQGLQSTMRRNTSTSLMLEAIRF